MKTKIFSMMVLGAMVAMTSCSNDDDLIVNNEVSNMVETGIVAKPISGVWYGCYKANGIAVSDSNDGETVDYAHVFDVYEFHENGTGTFHRHFMSEESVTPEISWGKEGRGDFTYTSTADGKVTITLKNEQGQPYDRKWHVDYKEEDGNIMAMGADNSNMTLTPACPSLKEVLDAWNSDMQPATRAAAAAAAPSCCQSASPHSWKPSTTRPSATVTA